MKPHQGWDKNAQMAQHCFLLPVIRVLNHLEFVGWNSQITNLMYAFCSLHLSLSQIYVDLQWVCLLTTLYSVCIISWYCSMVVDRNTAEHVDILKQYCVLQWYSWPNIKQHPQWCHLCTENIDRQMSHCRWRCTGIKCLFDLSCMHQVLVSLLYEISQCIQWQFWCLTCSKTIQQWPLTSVKVETGESDCGVCH